MRRLTQTADTEKLQAKSKREQLNERTLKKNILMVNLIKNISVFLICQNARKRIISKILNN